MTGAEARSSVRVAGDGRSATRTRRNGATRRVRTPIPRFAGLASADGRTARAFLCLIGTLGGGKVSAGKPNGECRIM